MKSIETIEAPLVERIFVLVITEYFVYRPAFVSAVRIYAGNAISMS